LNPESLNPLDSPPGGGPRSFSLASLAKLWNEQKPQALGGVNLPFARNNGEIKKLTAVVSRHLDPEWWTKLFAQVRDRPFLLGDNDRGWKATFDFVVKNAEKIMDGAYVQGAGKTEPGGYTPQWMKRLPASSSKT
jgi:hypothetical protein